MPQIGIGLIGLGYIGKVHLQNSQRLSHARLEAVADVSKKALTLATKSGVKKTFVDYEQLLKDPKVDCVIIALPTHFHLECVEKVAEAHKHILLEKPIARSTQEAKQIISVAERNSVKLMMGYPLRFNPDFQKTRETFKRGLLGEVVVAYATNVSSGPFFHRADGTAPVPVPEWWFKKELTGGGALIDLGSHMINLLRWYFGEVAEIRSYLGYRLNLDIEDSALCIVKFRSGVLATINVGWFSQDYSLSIELFGRVQHSRVEPSPTGPLVTAVQMLMTGTSKLFWDYRVELQQFINCLLLDKPSVSNAIDGLRDLEAIEMAYGNRID